MKDITDKDFLARELEIYNLINFRRINEDDIRAIQKVFVLQGHSGFTANYVLGFLQQLLENYEVTDKKLQEILDGDSSQVLITNNIYELYILLKDKSKEIQDITLKLLQHKPLTPLFGGAGEWNKIDDDTYQNKRCSSVFKHVFKNGLEVPYYLDTKVYTDDGGITYHTSSIYGRYEITFPFTPPEAEKVFVYKEDDTPIFYLTNPETIEKLKDISSKNYEEVK